MHFDSEVVRWPPAHRIDVPQLHRLSDQHPETGQFAVAVQLCPFGLLEPRLGQASLTSNFSERFVEHCKWLPGVFCGRLAIVLGCKSQQLGNDRSERVAGIALRLRGWLAAP